MDIRKLTEEELANSLYLIGVDVKKSEDIFVKAYENFIRIKPETTSMMMSGSKVPTPICDLYIATALFPYNIKMDYIDVKSLSTKDFLNLCEKIFLPVQDNNLIRLRAERILRIIKDFSTCSHFLFLSI